MKLITGKCKEEFHKWYWESEFSDEIHVSDFLELSLPMQFGVIQDFGDSVGINITLYQLDYQNWYGYNIVKFGKPISMGGVWRRDKARQESIKQFNKIYNEKH